MTGTKPVSLLGIEAEAEKTEIDRDSFVSPNEISPDFGTKRIVGTNRRRLEVLSIDAVSIENPVTRLGCNFQTIFHDLLAHVLAEVNIVKRPLMARKEAQIIAIGQGDVFEAVTQEIGQAPAADPFFAASLSER